MQSDGGDTERNKVSKTPTLSIPKREPITLGFMICARMAGKSVRTCSCMLKSGGWLECPPEAIGILHPAPQPGMVPEPSPQQPPAILRRPDPEPIGELGLVPRNPQQVAAAVAAERAMLAKQKSPGGKAAGFTGSICGHCGSDKMIRNGICETCTECYQSGECG